MHKRSEGVGCIMYKHVKRFLDLLISLFVLVFAFIPMIVIAIAIKLESKGPVFFKQKRYENKGLCTSI